MKQTRPPSSSSSPPPPSSRGEGYGGYGNYGDYGGYGGYSGYSGYYYGYGYGSGGYPGGGESAQPTRSFRDYLLILRERIWYVVVTFFVIFTAFVLYALNKTPQFTSKATVQIYRSTPSPLPGAGNSEDNIANDQDFNTRVRLMQSETIAQRVADRLKSKPQEETDFLAPYKSRSLLAGEETPVQRLMENVAVTPVRATLVIDVSYEHPNKEIAAVVAEYFAQEFISYNQELNASTAMSAVDDLQNQANTMNKTILEIETKKTDLVNKYGELSLNNKTDVLTPALQQQNSIVINYQSALEARQEEWTQVQAYQKDGKTLWDLPFIASNTHVAELLTKYDDLKTQLAAMQQKFAPKHPDIIQALQQKQTTETELTDAVNTAVQNMKSDLDSAVNNTAKAIASRDNYQLQIHEMAQHEQEYDNLDNELQVARETYTEMMKSIQEHISAVRSTTADVVMVDHANVPSTPSEPKVMLLIFGGLVGGLMGGVGMAFLVAYLDDRIKTAMDIEAVVGLPLLGILPRIRHLESSEKAQAVATNADRRITEAFRTIYSTLKLNDAAKNARAILVTSTVPSEGKSFVTTNLALTYAMHGERVLVIDCDLRMPNVAKSMGKESQEVGLMTHLLEGRPLEECMIKDFYPNLDLLTTGGKTRNPTQIFNSREFADFIAKMRQQYDRIFIDSPPIGAVSDALNLLPSVDGLLYVIKFNAVKRKTAKLNVRRLMEGNVPIFGAILNQISLSVASYYYTSYYDKSYRNYYVHDDDETPDHTQPAAARAETANEASKDEEKS